jgi:hypothetical protein
VAGAVVAAAALAVLTPIGSRDAKVRQRVHALDGFQVHAAAEAAVAAVGAAEGTNFSRRKLTQPRPPLPACTLSLASSTNFMRMGSGAGAEIKRGQVALPPFGSTASPGPQAHAYFERR